MQTKLQGFNDVFLVLMQNLDEYTSTNQNSNLQIFNYLKLVAYFLDQGVDPNLIYAELCAKDNCSFFHSVVQSDALNVSMLFQLVDTLLDHGLPKEKIIAALTSVDQTGNNIGCLLAQKQGEALNQIYLKCLFQLYRRGIKAETILVIFNTPNDEGMNYGMLLVKNNLNTNVEYYLQLLKLFFDEGVDQQEIQSLIDQKGKVDEQSIKTLIDLLMDQHNIKLIYQLLSQGFVPKNLYHSMHHLKAVIKDYILNMSNVFFRKNALRDALDPTHPLGDFFNDYFFYSSTVQEIKRTLAPLESADKIRWSAEFFPPVKVTEIDSHLHFIDPYETKFKRH